MSDMKPVHSDVEESILYRAIWPNGWEERVSSAEDYALLISSLVAKGIPSGLHPKLYRKDVMVQREYFETGWRPVYE